MTYHQWLRRYPLPKDYRTTTIHTARENYYNADVTRDERRTEAILFKLAQTLPQ